MRHCETFYQPDQPDQLDQPDQPDQPDQQDYPDALECHTSPGNPTVSCSRTLFLDSNPQEAPGNHSRPQWKRQDTPGGPRKTRQDAPGSRSKPQDGPESRRMPQESPYTFVLPHKTHQPIQNTLFCRTKRTKRRKIPYFAAQNAPTDAKYLILPNKSHQATENTLSCRTGKKISDKLPFFLLPNY